MHICVPYFDLDYILANKRYDFAKPLIKSLQVNEAYL